MRWADVYVCMLADGVALRNRCPQGQLGPGPHPRRARHSGQRHDGRFLALHEGAGRSLSGPPAARRPGQFLHHSTPAVQAWLAKHPNVEFHFTPKGASWLNMVEAWFGIFTRKSVRRGSFDTVRALIRHIEAYIADWNSHPTPFVWTKDPAAIVTKAVRRGR